MTVTFLNPPIDISITTITAFTDIDVSANVPAGATGVIIEIVNNDAATSRDCGLRKNGSTDNRTGQIRELTHIWTAIGIDDLRRLEGYIETTDVDFWLVGYFDYGATFFTNAVDKSLSATLAWTDIDISGDTQDVAKTAIFEVQGPTSNTIYGLRKNGSTDDRGTPINQHNWALVGVDDSELCEGWIQATTLDFFLVGYIFANVIMATNAPDRSLGSTGAYADLSALPANTKGTIYEVTSGGFSQTWNIRRKGASNDRQFGAPPQHAFCVTEVDASGIAEGIISSIGVDFFEMGYFGPIPAPIAWVVG